MIQRLHLPHYLKILTLILLLSPNVMAYTLVFIGDSLTEGYSLAKSSAYPALIETKLKQYNPQSKVINAGISGSTSQSAVSQVKWYVKSNPNLIVIALGANDGLRGQSEKQLRENLTAAVTLAQSKNVKVLLAGMQLPSNYGATYRENFKKVYTEISQHLKIPLIPFLLEGVAMNPKLNLPDKIHPNEAGHKVMAATVWPYIQKELGIK